jgi:deoxyhypusine synthase
MDARRKRQHLKHPRIEIEAGRRTAGELLEDMAETAFQGRKMGEAFAVWKQMLSERNTTVFMGLAGAMVPAGMGRLVSFLVERRGIDVLVTTGAALSHDLYQALGRQHFMGTPQVDDDELQRLRIDRVYDTYTDEDGLYAADKWVMRTLPELLDDHTPYTSREIVEVIGREVNKMKHGRGSLLATAYRSKLPIFVPAFGDSSIGFALMFANRKRKRNIVVDMMRDVDQTCQITERAGKTGVVLIGGGVPKNYIQQTAVVAGYETDKEMMHKFGVSITTDSPQWGGLSGCTFDESKSWGKYDVNAVFATCYADATIALPMLVNGLAEWKGLKNRKPPRFDWSGKRLKLTY